jgi:hypothetical protein
MVRNAGFSREMAQTPCRNDLAIWEIRASTLTAFNPSRRKAVFKTDRSLTAAGRGGSPSGSVGSTSTTTA